MRSLGLAPAMPALLGLALLGFALLGLASCAATPVRPHAPPPMAALSGTAPPGTGIVLVVRAVGADDSGPGGAWRGLLLSSADDADAAAAPPGPVSEIIVRQAGGALISIVQPADPALRAGAAVSIARRTTAAGRVTVARL